MCTYLEVRFWLFLIVMLRIAIIMRVGILKPSLSIHTWGECRILNSYVSKLLSQQLRLRVGDRIISHTKFRTLMCQKFLWALKCREVARSLNIFFFLIHLHVASLAPLFGSVL